MFEGNQELFLWRWNEDSKVDFVYRDLFYTDSGSNYHHYSDPKADELTDAIASEKTRQNVLQIPRNFREYLVEACPQVPYTLQTIIAYNKNLKVSICSVVEITTGHMLT